MNIVFFASSDFSIPSLEKLIKSGHKILGVVTQPDSKKGRHLVLSQTPVKKFAVERGIKVLQPDKLNDKKFLEDLKKLNTDVFVVVAYGKILPKIILSVPKIMPLNIHASLLPKYRGAAPINWAIINGERTTGITIIKMNQYMDRGDIIAQKKLDISPADNAVTLSERLAILGSELIIEVLKSIESGEATFSVQNDSEVSFAPELQKEDGLIDWKKSAQAICSQVKGLLPWPGTFTHYNKKVVKIWDAEVVAADSQESQPGTIIDVAKSHIYVVTGSGVLGIKTLQLESGKKLQIEQFIAGHKIAKADKFY